MICNTNGPHGYVSRLVGIAETAKEVAGRPSVRPWLLLASTATFVAIAYFSFRSLDDGRSIHPLLMLPIVFLAAPAALVLNALEYRAMGLALGHRMDVRSAAKVGLTATLANYLPAPGGVAVRTAALKVRGSTVGSAVSINAVAGLMWLGVAGLAAGVALMTMSALQARGALSVGGGVVALVVSALWIRRNDPQWATTFRRLLWVETGIVAVAGLRVWMALLAIGQEVSIGAAVAISSSAVIAAAIGIFPAGLGLREVIGGTLAVAVAVPFAAATAALAVDRVAGQLGMALCVPFVGLGRRRQQEPSLYKTTEPAEAARQK